MASSRRKEPDFPVDETTLVLLDAACQVNPDSGHTELGTFLDMTAGPIKSVTNELNGEVFSTMEEALEAWDSDEAAVFFVDRELGDAPHSPHTVIRALVAEIRRQRQALREIGCVSEGASCELRHTPTPCSRCAALGVAL